MKKIISLTLSILLTICLVNIVYADSLCKVDLQVSKSKLSKNEEFSVNVVLSNIQDEKGIMGFSAVLEYDKNSLEYVKIEEQDGWESASYNENNGKIAILRNQTFAKTDQTIFKIIFKANVENKDKVEIYLRDVRTTNGSEESKLGILKNTVTINTNNNNDNENNNNNNDNTDDNNDDNNGGNNGDNNGGNNNNNSGNANNNNSENNNGNSGNNNENKGDINNINQGNNNNGNDNKMNTNLPKTGNDIRVTISVVVGIVLLIIVGIILYVKIREINKMERM